MEMQNTVKNPVFYSGIALHTGARANLGIKPAAPDTGILFRRIDLPGAPEIKALATNVVDVRRGTTIASGKGFVVTVEHVLSAFNVAGIDNAIVDMDGAEPPIADGSEMPYLKLILDPGTECQ